MNLKKNSREIALRETGWVKKGQISVPAVIFSKVPHIWQGIEEQELINSSLK